MAIVTIQAPSLNDIQKKRVGERILDSLHSEGVPASSIVVLFKPDDTDIFLDGGLLFEARHHHGAPAVSSSTVTTVPKKPSAAAAKAPAPAKAAPAAPAPAKAPAAPAPAKARVRVRAHAPQQMKKSLPGYSEAKDKIRAMFLNHGGLSSFQAQSGLDLKGHEGASALLRKIFADLELEGMVEKQGQKRGTRYVLKGITANAPQQSAPVILVKQDKQEEAPGAPDPHEAGQENSDYMGS